MPVIINPFGRYVAVDDPKEYERWTNTPGFQIPTKNQLALYEKEQVAKIRKAEYAKEVGKGIYLATVSVGGKDGYGRAAELLGRELEVLGIPVTRYYNEQRVAILFHNPYGILRIEAPYRIIYTMFESDKIPDDWHDYLQAADKVLVPSKWCQSVFKKAGVETEVLPLGYDDDVFVYHKRKIKNLKKENFTFLHYNAFNARKGFIEVFNAFTKEFKKTEPVKLILKTTLNNTPSAAPINKSRYPNIEIIHGKCPETKLVDILNRSDCFVFPSRGEGFGITPLEAMATGMPAIVPNAHGITEYFDPKFMYEVKVEGKCPALYTRYKGQDVGQMVRCDVDDLRRKMRWAYEHQADNLELGLKASEYVKEWTFKKTANQLQLIYNDIISKPITERKLKNILTLEQVK